MQGKNVEEFDHVKHDRMLEAEDLDQDATDKSNVKKENMSEDMQRMMQKLNSADATKVLTPDPGQRSFLSCVRMSQGMDATYA